MKPAQQFAIAKHCAIVLWDSDPLIRVVVCPGVFIMESGHTLVLPELADISEPALEVARQCGLLMKVHYAAKRSATCVVGPVDSTTTAPSEVLNEFFGTDLQYDTAEVWPAGDEERAACMLLSSATIRAGYERLGYAVADERDIAELLEREYSSDFPRLLQNRIDIEVTKLMKGVA